MKRRISNFALEIWRERIERRFVSLGFDAPKNPVAIDRKDIFDLISDLQDSRARVGYLERGLRDIRDGTWGPANDFAAEVLEGKANL